MPYKDKKKQLEIMRKINRDYRRRKAEELKLLKKQIEELKELASEPHTITTSIELAEKIKQL
jgi:hypothetical protein